MNFEYKSEPMDLGAGAKDQDAVAGSWRAILVAFLGENSAKSLEAIADKSANIDKNGPVESGQEMGFYADVSSTREIIFKELALPPGSNATSDGYPMEKALKYHGNAESLFGYGHTHTKGWHFRLGNAPAKEFGRNSNLTYYGEPTPRSQNLPNDYKNYIRANVPLFIGSPVGITIYSVDKYYNSKNVTDYKWFKK